jgi:hypothetical protein
MSDQAAEAELLDNSQTLATVAHAILRRKYGEQAYDWDLVTIMMEVRDDYSTAMASAVTNRWAAIQTIMTTDAFFKRLDAFMAICNTLTTGDPYFTLFDPVTVEEAAWAISEVSLNREMLPFSYPIKQYLRQILRMDGYAAHDTPDVFDSVLEPGKDVTSVREQMRLIQQSANRDVVEAYIDDQLNDMAYQFNKVPSLSMLDDQLMEAGSETLVANL